MELTEIFAELDNAITKLRAAEANQDWFAARRATNDLTVLLNRIQAAAGIKVATFDDLAEALPEAEPEPEAWKPNRRPYFENCPICNGAAKIREIKNRDGSGLCHYHDHKVWLAMNRALAYPEGKPATISIERASKSVQAASLALDACRIRATEYVQRVELICNKLAVGRDELGQKARRAESLRRNAIERLSRQRVAVLELEPVATWPEWAQPSNNEFNRRTPVLLETR